MNTWNNTIVGTPKAIDKLKALIDAKFTFDSLIPVPGRLTGGALLDWRKTHWGCRYNPLESSYNNDNTAFWFATNGAPAIPVVKQISTKLEDEHIKYMFSDSQNYDHQLWTLEFVAGNIIKASGQQLDWDTESYGEPVELDTKRFDTGITSEM